MSKPYEAITQLEVTGDYIYYNVYNSDDSLYLKWQPFELLLIHAKVPPPNAIPVVPVHKS